MQFELNWVGVGVIIAALGNAYHTVSWSSRITTQLENMAKCLDGVGRELEKRDAQISAAWKKIDGLDVRVTRVETKCNITHVGETA